MSGGWFLVSLEDVEYSEKILKIKPIIKKKERLNIDHHLKITNDLMSGIELVERSVQHIIRYVNHISLSDKKREVSDHVVGYIANKL